ncbi:sigma-70 family RNA polymerase sigma factor [Kitasatospora sp. NPDC059795]|uniref:sigma-70 family RNA polymerase sigma factor n=1 Tax=Kitasatospora sp. NPDC059795 TaxID=3346949 RepID=UPI00366618FA
MSAATQPPEPDQSSGFNVEASSRLHKAISDELREYDSRISRQIRKKGFREPDLSEIKSDVQVRFYKARICKVSVYEQDTPWPFMRRTIEYAILDFLRQRGNRRERYHLVEDVPENKAACRDSVTASETVELRDAIRTVLIKHLPANLREIYWLRFAEERGVVEISKILGIDRGTVSSRLLKATEVMNSLPPEVLDGLR